VAGATEFGFDTPDNMTVALSDAVLPVIGIPAISMLWLAGKGTFWKPAIGSPLISVSVTVADE
jgi:hypothetical protein